MIKFEHTDVYGFEHAIRGMRNPFDSWEKSDSGWHDVPSVGSLPESVFTIGSNDKDLCERLNRGGSPHNKFLRQIICWVDITATRLWWHEMATYRFGVEVNSCSTMHRITAKPFTLADFTTGVWPKTIDDLNDVRDRYLSVEDPRIKKEIWRELIDNLPQSYLQKRTVMLSYQAIRAICQQRKGHKLGEWHDFIDWAHRLPESWLLFDEEE